MPRPKSSTGPGVPEEHRRRWTETYASTPYRRLPWFSPTPYPWVAEAVKAKRWIPGTRLLDVGCGAGTNSLFLARAGFEVTGIDLAPAAVEAARARAAKARSTARFEVADALRLPFPDGHFGGAIDIGCFHTLPPDLRPAYAKEIARVVRPRRSFVLSWVAREFRGEEGPPHRLSVEEAAAALEEDFLFLHTEYRPGASGRSVRGGLPVYCAVLGRRSFPRPPPR
ncbi:MAG TPA: methyltransferase domain-containing protein [Thermoplasmata archaeon]|nr:methyltransferase domain-containing protein [Thermoplasmata archaeon]